MDAYRDCIVFLLGRAYQRARSNFTRRLRRHGLTHIQTLILSALWENEGLSAGEIGRRSSLDNATLSGVLDPFSL
jgi:DNA-binding MarR family transcriptional regulator